MATSQEFIEYVCAQIAGTGDLRYRKMFGEYMVYLNDKPIFTVCDSTVYIKKLDCVAELMKNSETGNPYDGAKEHYILEIDDAEKSRTVALLLEKEIPIPKKRGKK